jgi:tetratricopeptide (TPR) repeat protein
VVVPGDEWGRTLALLLGRSPDDDLVLTAADFPADTVLSDHAPVEAVNAAVARAERIAAPAERARAFVAAAELAQGNADRAVALYEAAIADDPATPGAFEAIVRVLEGSGDARGLEQAMTRQLDRLAGKGRDDAEAALLLRLADLREGALDDHLGAIHALDALVRVRPTDIDARVRLAALLAAREENALAIRCLEIVAEYAPQRAATYRSILSLAKRESDVDRAYLAAAALVQLGEADGDDQAIYQLGAPQTTLRLTGPVDEALWDDLAPPEYDADMTAVLAAVSTAAIGVRIGELAKSLGLPPLLDRHRQDPDSSTVAAVRTVAWAAKVLRVPCPAVYARGDLPGGLVSVPAEMPSVVLGKAMLTGRALPELSFLAARELGYQRATASLATFFPSVPELRDLVRTAISLYLPNVAPQPPIPGLREALASRLGIEQRKALEAAIRSLTARGGSLDLAAYLRGAELLACRVALLVSGDVSVAARVLATDGRLVAGLSAADRVRDLTPFSVSTRFVRARERLGIRLGEAGGSQRMSVPPPRMGG